MSQTSTNLLEGRKREEQVGELGNVARHKRGLTPWRGRKREEQDGELENVAHHKRGLTSWRGGRGRCELVSAETWHVTDKDSLAGGEEEGGAG